ALSVTTRTYPPPGTAGSPPLPRCGVRGAGRPSPSRKPPWRNGTYAYPDPPGSRTADIGHIRPFPVRGAEPGGGQCSAGSGTRPAAAFAGSPTQTTLTSEYRQAVSASCREAGAVRV